MISSHLNLASLNVNGLRSQVTNGVPKRRKIFTWLKNLKFEIIYLQETHSSIETENQWRNEWGGNIYFAHGESNSRGVAILIRPNTGFTVRSVYADSNGRFLTLEINVNGTWVTLGNYYGPNSDNQKVVEEFCFKVMEYENSTIVLGGDWNFGMNKAKDRISSGQRNPNNDKSRDVLLRYLIDNDMYDVWRELNPTKNEFTYLKRNPVSKSRIDFFVVSRDVMYSENEPLAEIRDGYLSDHKLITAVISIPTIELGKSYWKFNNALLKDNDFVSMIRHKISQILDENRSSTTTNCILFETLLCVLRGYIIKYSAHKKRESARVLGDLEEQLKNLDADESSDRNIIEGIRAERDNVIEDLARKGMFFGKVRWRNLAERGTKYFHGLSRRNRGKNITRTLFINVGSEVQQATLTNCTEQMLEEGKSFFTQMYAKEACNLDGLAPFLERLPNISEEHKAFCDEVVDMESLNFAVSSIRNNSSPGPSGYTGEFYKYFFPELKTLLLSVCHEIFESGTMPTSMKKSITILIPKRGKDCRNLSNMRPISLLNTFYKIITKHLAIKLSCVVKSIINEDQTGFIKGRFIGENIRLILDIIDFSNNQDLTPLLLACDVKQAYDCVDWHYLKTVVSAFGFGRSFKRWIDILYDTNHGNLESMATASVQINGKLSKPYNIHRGLRQGCPASCLLFLLCFEPLLNRIRRCEEIRGLTIGDTVIKTTSYADDVTLILDGSDESLKACLNVFEEFKKVSGLGLNHEKTKALWVGKESRWKYRICPEYKIQWPDSSIEILGIKISNDPTVDLNKINYESKYENMLSRLTPWNSRGLTPFGRIHLVKSELLSQLIYLMSVLPAPGKDFAQKVETDIFRFVWGGKRDRIKRATLKAKYKEGGLKVPDILARSHSLKIAWVKKYMDEQNRAKWKAVMKSSLSVTNDFNIFHCDGNEKILNKWIKNRFWVETCLAWMSIKRVESLNGAQILSQVIWAHRDIGLERNNTLNRRMLISKGLIKICDMYNLTERKILSTNQIAHKFSIHPMTARSITLAIPPTWLSQLERDRPQYEDSGECIENLQAKHKTAGWAYEKLTPTYSSIGDETCHQKWQNELGTNNECQWPKVYNDLHYMTRDLRLRWLNYQCIKRILPTKRRLYLYGLAETDKCQLCPIYSETILHKFWQCPGVRFLWIAVKELLEMENNLTPSDIFLGVNITDDTKRCQVNQVILLTKSFIWKHRDNPNLLKVSLLKRHIAQYLDVESYIAKIDNKSSLYSSVWDRIYRRVLQ